MATYTEQPEASKPEAAVLSPTAITTAFPETATVKTRQALGVGYSFDFQAACVPCESVSGSIGTGVLSLARDRSLARVRVLLVEDDEKLANSVRSGIEQEGWQVMRAKTAETALYLLPKSRFDVVLLDIVLPGNSGLQLLKAMRADRIATPVVVISGRDAVSDRVLGLESGADDYLVKPFAVSELLARIRALLRRQKPARPRQLKCADLEIDARAHTAMRAGASLALTFREFEILECLCRNQGRVVTRQMLARDIWKETNRYSPLDNVINVHIARLRRKIDDNCERKLLHTVRGMGFILREEAA
jgi:DNA-binding response OmpR family regulator